jgi:hypothetical protein
MAGDELPESGSFCVLSALDIPTILNHAGKAEISKEGIEDETGVVCCLAAR